MGDEVDYWDDGLGSEAKAAAAMGSRTESLVAGMDGGAAEQEGRPTQSVCPRGWTWKRNQRLQVPRCRKGEDVADSLKAS